MKTSAQRQKSFRQTRAAEGLVRLEAYVSRELRDKFKRIGGADWLRKQLARAKDKTP
jgi:hypothetical protein